MSDSGSNSEWIYVVLTLVAGALSYFKSLSKKKNTPEKTVIHPENEMEWERTEGIDGEETNIVEEYSNEKYEYNSNCIESNQIPAEGDYYNEKLTEVRIGITEADTAEETENEASEFDPRQAVIYSEILNRKYN